MIESYFTNPDTLDQIRRCWLSEHLETYVEWLVEQGYGPGAIYRRVPVVRRFADFAKERDALSQADLPALVEPFVSGWIAERDKGRSAQRTRDYRNEIRGPVEQFLSLMLPTFVPRGRQPHGAADPFLTSVPDFLCRALADH